MFQARAEVIKGETGNFGEFFGVCFVASNVFREKLKSPKVVFLINKQSDCGVGVLELNLPHQ